MLSTSATETVLYSAPSFKHLIGTYKRKLKYLLGFSFNTQGVAAEIVFEMILDTINRIEALSLFKNVVDTALSFLKDRERMVIEKLFFEDRGVEDIAKELEIKTYDVENDKRSALKRLGTNIEFLGFDYERIIENFNDYDLFIENASKVNKKREMRENFNVK